MLSMRDTEARQVITRLRGGTNELRIEKGRYAITTRDRPLERCERRCMICWNGEIEDEMHFMLDCDVYDDLRERMMNAYSHALAKQRKETATQTNLDIQKMRKEEGRKKEAVGGSYWRCNTSKRTIETFGLHFLQTSNETQEQSRSVCFRPNDLKQHRDNKAKNNTRRRTRSNKKGKRTRCRSAPRRRRHRSN